MIGPSTPLLVRRKGSGPVHGRGDGFLYTHGADYGWQHPHRHLKGAGFPRRHPSGDCRPDQEQAGFTAPACGLYLDEVFYMKGEMALPSPENK